MDRRKRRDDWKEFSGASDGESDCSGGEMQHPHHKKHHRSDPPHDHGKRLFRMKDEGHHDHCCPDHHHHHGKHHHHDCCPDHHHHHGKHHHHGFCPDFHHHDFFPRHRFHHHAFKHCPPFFFCDNRVRFNLAGLNGNLPFQFFRLRGCRVRIEFECAGEIREVEGVVCNVGNDHVSVQQQAPPANDKSGSEGESSGKAHCPPPPFCPGQVTTVLIERICQVEWLDPNCNPCVPCPPFHHFPHHHFPHFGHFPGCC
ncbi:MAG: hypothetical protein ACOY94_27565 [Bacillota bacterium]